MNDGPLDERVLVLAPTARDGATSGGLLESARIPHFLCNSIDDVCREAGRGAGAAVVTAEAVLRDAEGRLTKLLKAQPPWSDFPLVVLTPPGAELPRLLQALDGVGHMTLMKRPVQVSTLVSTIQSALRDRRRQYVVRDLLAQRQHAADILRTERERYRITLSSIGDAVISTDADGRVTFLNSMAESLTGWTKTEAAGRPLPEVFRIVNEHTRRTAENPALRALQEGSVVGLANHTVLIAKDGAERPIDDSASPMRDGEGVTIGSVLVFRDVTERKRAEDVLRESEKRYRRAAADAATAAESNAKFRAFFDQGTNFAAVLTLDGTVVEANRLCLDACGFTRDEVIGKPFWECGWWSRSPSVADMVRTACAQAAAGQMFRTRTNYFVADGSERTVDLILAPVTDEAGRVLFVAATGNDVTERSAMEKALRDADRKKDEFLALLAHELRNPLAPIRNGLQVMRLAGSDANTVGQARSMMDRQLSHMVRLIDDLLDISRISRNKMELRRSRVSLWDVVSSAVETARPAIDAEEHELNVLLPQGPVFLDADLTRLAQVFSNLLTNSAKYTARGGRIWLSAERRGGVVLVSVRDTGIGIPADSLETIFDMFSQVDRSVERSTGGLGIGLALVKGLVEMHGGSVTAQSAGHGYGSTFTVSLPVMADQPVHKETSEDAERIAARPKRRILVVDDNRDGADSLSLMLKLMGDDVYTAHDGVEAIKQTEAFRPEVILMDVGMPRLNGLDATRRIREQPWGREIKIIALTGWGQLGDRDRSREAGCDGHLVKPVDLQILQQMLNDLHGKKG
jgi:PAS domain S-box-containing protein